jgi:hypothetical protein
MKRNKPSGWREPVVKIINDLIYDIGSQVTRDYEHKNGIWEGLSVSNAKRGSGAVKEIGVVISQELQDLLEWVNKELIGEIEYPFGYNGRGLENVIRNGLRRKQRKLLKEKKKEIK